MVRKSAIGPSVQGNSGFTNRASARRIMRSMRSNRAVWKCIACSAGAMNLCKPMKGAISLSIPLVWSWAFGQDTFSIPTPRGYDGGTRKADCSLLPKNVRNKNANVRNKNANVPRKRNIVPNYWPNACGRQGLIQTRNENEPLRSGG